MDFTNLTSPAKAKALAKLSNGWSITTAMKAAGYTRQTYYDWREHDPDFAKLADEAMEMGTDALEDEATRQAKRGNTTLIITMLKARRPERFADRKQVDITIQLRKKAELLAESLGVPVDDVIAEAEAVAAGAWESWSP